MKRIFLFIATNLAVMVLLSIILNVLGLNRFLTESGINVGALLAFSLVVGFTGSFVSLLMSKPMAKWSTGAQVIDAPQGADELWLVNTRFSCLATLDHEHSFVPRWRPAASR